MYACGGVNERQGPTGQRDRSVEGLAGQDTRCFPTCDEKLLGGFRWEQSLLLLALAAVRSVCGGEGTSRETSYKT